MSIVCGLEDASYKYVHGIFMKRMVPFEESKQIRLICGRNDRAAVQLLLYSEQEMMVGVAEDPYFYERGSIAMARVAAAVPGIRQEEIEVKLIGLVEDDDRQLKADVLLEQSHIYVEARRVQCVWIEVNIAKNVKPGMYQSQIVVYGQSMFEDEVVIRQLSFEIEVIETVLRDAQEYPFHLNLWQHNSNISRKYDVPLWSDEHFNIMEQYLASLAELGQKALSIIVSEVPWSGQFSSYDRIQSANLYEYSMIRIRKTGDGEWDYDYSAVNRYIQLGISLGIKQEIEVFGLLNIWQLEDVGFGKVIEDYSDAVRVRYWDEASGTYKYLKKKQEFSLYVAALEANFIAHGWIERVRVIADEPADPVLFKERLDALKEMAPSFRYKAAINHASFIEEQVEGIVDYIPILDCITDEYEKIQRLKGSIQGYMSYYVCCVPELPNTFICSHLLESRVIPWLAFYMNMDGFLRWNYTVWPNNPNESIRYHYPLYPAGDLNFVYPGRNGKPMLSLRYKLLQKGLRDYDIMQQYVEQGGSREVVLEKMKSIFLWESIKELNPKFRKKRDELFELDPLAYESIINYLLKV